jgi:hypothetical protein
VQEEESALEDNKKRIDEGVQYKYKELDEVTTNIIVLEKAKESIT